jgi:hypothetical protein
MTNRRNLFKVSTVTQLLLDLAILGWLDKTLPMLLVSQTTSPSAGEAKPEAQPTPQTNLGTGMCSKPCFSPLVWVYKIVLVE